MGREEDEVMKRMVLQGLAATEMVVKVRRIERSKRSR